MDIAVRVACYAGYRGEETPRRLVFEAQEITVAEVLDRWLAPDHRYFKILGDDGALYILRHDAVDGRWELVLYERRGPEPRRSDGKGLVLRLAAARRTNALLERGDMDGCAVGKRIVRAVEELHRKERREGKAIS